MTDASAPADGPIIALAGVTKTYGEGQAAFQALRGIDFTVDEGEFVAVMGPSGSGKSTAMNIIGCLDTPTGGTYLFRGVHVERLSRRQRALLRRHYLGFVFQGFNLLARTSAQENVELPLLYRGEPALVRRAAATLERLESEAARHNPQRDLFDDAGGASTDPGRSGTFDDMPPEESAPFDDTPFDAAGPAASLAPDPAPDPARLAAAAIARELEDLDPEDLTPRQAHERLRAWHGRLQQS